MSYFEAMAAYEAEKEYVAWVEEQEDNVYAEVIMPEYFADLDASENN